MGHHSLLFGGKRVLVTGATGFKGSWLAIWLRELGATVTGISLPPRGPEELFVRAGLQTKIEHHDLDIRDAGGLAGAVAAARPQIVLHLAAQALVLESYRSPLETYATNVMGTANLLQACRECEGLESVVVVTSDKCYHNREFPGAYREDDPLGGHDPYSASKGAAEIVTASFARSYFGAGDRPAVVTARAGNVIGGGDWAPDRLVPDAIRALRRGCPVELRNPDAVRPWQHVLEPLSGYLSLALASAADKGRFAGAWNFGPLASSAVPVRRVADMVVKHWGSGSVTVDETDNKPHEAGLLHLDTTKSVSVLGWRPMLGIEDTIRWTIEDYRALADERNDAHAVCVKRIREYMALRECCLC